MLHVLGAAFHWPADVTHWSEAPPDRVVTMPPCPSTNALWIRVAGKARVRSQAYRQWASAAGWEVRRQIAGIPPVDCRFNALIETPTTRRDVANFEKATMDLCESCGLITNDGNAVEILMRQAARSDVLVALWCLPELGDVRPAPRSRLPGVAWGGTGKRRVRRLTP